MRIVDRSVRAGLWGLGAFTAAVLVAGCGNPFGSSDASGSAAQLSGRQVEKTIDAKIPQQFPSFDVGPAHCPGSLDPHSGSPGICTITVDGQKARVAVTRGGSSGSYHVATTEALVDVPQLERTLVHRTHGLEEVHCGTAKARVIDPPGTIACTGNTARRMLHLKVTIRDVDGDYTVREKQAQ